MGIAIASIRDFVVRWRDFSGRTGSLPARWAAAFVLLFFVPAMVLDLDLWAVKQTITLDPEWVETSGFLNEPTTFENADQIPEEAILGVTYSYSLYEYETSAWTLVPALVFGIPFTALLARRAQDIGYPGHFAVIAVFLAFLLVPLTSVILADNFVPSGFFLLISFVAIGAGWIASICALVVIAFWFFRPSQPGPNKYGPNPHEVTP